MVPTLLKVLITDGAFICKDVTPRFQEAGFEPRASKPFALGENVEILLEPFRLCKNMIFMWYLFLNLAW